MKPNVFDRLAMVFGRTTKAQLDAPSLFPPRATASFLPLTFPGWERLEAMGTSQSEDEKRARTSLRSPWVYSDITAIANEFASSILEVTERRGTGEEAIPNHELEQLWEAPNPHMGRHFLMSYWSWSYLLSGKAALFWVYRNGMPVEVWPLPPFSFTPIPDAKTFIAGYAFRTSSAEEPRRIPTEYITYSHSVNLFDVRDGLSFHTAAMLGIEGDLAAAEWNRNNFREQNGVPDGMITVPRDTLDEQLIAVRQEIREFFGGTRRGVAVARAGELEYTPFARTQKDMEFHQLREFAQKETDRTLLFPEGYWSERANRANAEQARETMIAQAVWPLLLRLAEDMNAQFLPRWASPELRVRFKDIRPQNRELQLQELNAYKDHLTIDELRELNGRKPLGDYRGQMLIAEVAKGAPLPATPASILSEATLLDIQNIQANAAPTPPTDETATPSEAPTEEAVKAEWRRWEGKARKAIKAGKSPNVPFSSSLLPPDAMETVRAQLATATDEDAVKAVFRRPRRPYETTEIEAAMAQARVWAEAVQT